MNRRILTTLISIFLASTTHGQSINEYRSMPIPFGDMNSWRVRIVNESAVIGGEDKTLYEIAKGDTIRGNIAYEKDRFSPWATSTVMAKVSGVTKASVSVFPERREDGYCAKLEVRLEHCKVLGLFNISVVAGGTIFLGEVAEPIKDTKNPQSKLMMGIPFTERPAALALDYNISNVKGMIKSTGFSKSTTIAGDNKGECCIVLQKRWEDSHGNIFAKRIGTGWEHYGGTSKGWVNNHVLKINYGDITKEPFYKPYMGLINGEHTQYSKNSRGEIKPVQEIGYALATETPTHLIVRISSSNAGAYVGGVGSNMLVDNVRLLYNK